MAAKWFNSLDTNSRRDFIFFTFIQRNQKYREKFQIVASMVNTKNQVCDFHFEVVRLGGAYIYEFNVHVCKQLYAYQLIAMLCILECPLFCPSYKRSLDQKTLQFCKSCNNVYTKSLYKSHAVSNFNGNGDLGWFWVSWQHWKKFGPIMSNFWGRFFMFSWAKKMNIFF